MFEMGATPKQLGAQLLDDLAKVEVATIGHWRLWGFCDRTIERRVAGATVAGTAITVACPRDDNSALHHAIEVARPGDIIVVDRLGEKDTACLGEIVAEAAKIAGVKAIVVDGPCTDSTGLKKIGLPIWCRGFAPRTTGVKGVGGRVNVPVSIGGVVVMPGDALLCDDDGVLVIPPAEVALEAARALRRQEEALSVIAALRSGGKLGEMSGARRHFSDGAWAQ